MRKIVDLAFILIFLFVSFFCVGAQNPSGIQSKCGGTLLYSSVQISTLGDIDAAPCAGRNFLINGVPIPNPSSIITGTGTANFVPRFTSAQVLADTPFSWNNTLYAWNNTALNAQFGMDLTPSVAAGVFRVGDYTTTPTTYFTLTQASSTITASCRTCSFGDIAGAGGLTQMQIFDSGASAFAFANGSGTAIVFDLGNSNILFNLNNIQIKNNVAINNSSDCAGSATIGGGGTVNVAITCTNDANSIVMVVYDNTAVANILPLSAQRTGANQITIRGDAAATVKYWIINRY